MRVFIYTLGCKVNEVDSELYAQEIRALGGTVVADLADADAIIVNACSVTNRAQAQSLQFARRAVREKPGARVFLTGCGASLLRLTHAEAPAGVTAVGMLDRPMLAKLVTDLTEAERDEVPWIERALRRAGPRNRVDVRIQEGCDNLCTYCVIPYVRGSRLQSKPAPVAVTEVVNLAATGVKEIVLTGTEIGKYGDGQNGLSSLLEGMLEALEAAGLPTRLRISSLNPDAITDALVRLFEQHPALCPQLHLPLQSGSDAVLGRMRRPYAVKDVLTSVGRLRSIDPLFALTTDVIVGFPGETDQDAQATMDVVEAAAFAKVHVFRFSARPFTAAAQKRGQIPASVARDRLHRVLGLSEQVGINFARQFLGKDVTIVSEQVASGVVRGYSEYYLWTEGLAGSNALPQRDSFVPVRIDGCRFDGERVVLQGNISRD